MHPKRRQRLTLVAFLFAGVAVAVGLALFALNENINLFYPPDQIARGEAPTDQRIRAGGMVLEGSVKRDPGSLAVRFTLSDMAGHNVPVVYEGILPDLFGEGQGIVATGRLRANGTFEATEVLAKHDENYMPPELAAMAGRKAPEGQQAGLATLDAGG
ncbi:MAG: cytochrome c maturation protein CcmE [Pseudomonadota bacterium]|jgi:cytochrome c-type biogenesis protein CcmE|nr:cytochrome c maturation protein CcmE [Pseudomonadales bacterium]MDA0955555.1 cytochrome c maturation protein CcmE [Pseudomonadota bacterium]